MPAGDGVWRVWKVLEGLEGLEGFGRFGAFAGGQTAAFKAHSHCCGLGRGVPVGEVALALGCLLGKVFGGFGRFWRVFGGFLEGLEGFGGWSDRTSSTPALVPGAAPALVKAGVGGYIHYTYIHYMYIYIYNIYI